MYKIATVEINKIEEIKNGWIKLESGADMTYFQSYDWNKMLVEYAPRNNWWRESKFVYVKKFDKIVLIAPIWIIKHDYKIINKKGVCSFARYEWSDYVNFIYSEFIPETIELFFEYIMQQFKLNRFNFTCLKEDTRLYQYIKKTKSILSDSKGTCVRLELPNTLEEYDTLLSKSTRQNIRTAYNRMKKNDVAYSIKFNDVAIDKVECVKFRQQRCIVKANKKSFSLERLKYKLIEDFLLFKLKDYLPIVSDKKSRFLSFYEKDKMKAFFNYGYSPHVNTVYAMSAGFDADYSKYSPGLIAMYEFIQNAISEKKIKVVDFTRGTEFYKYALGGTEHYIHNIEFVV